MRADERAHPYMQASAWRELLTFWRSGTMYSDKTKAYFEKFLKRILFEEKVMAKLSPEKRKLKLT